MDPNNLQNNQAQVPQPPTAPATVATQPQNNPVQPAPVAPIAQAPDEAEMDKAWIDQAVIVLDKTREDPFLQSQEIAKLKAQYMQAKFDKQLKIAEE